MVSKEDVAIGVSIIFGFIGALSTIILLSEKASAKPAKTIYAVPSSARPGEQWTLYIRGFIPPTVTIIVQGYGVNPDATYVRNLRPDGSAELTFTVEADRPAGDYWISVADSESGLTMWFTVLPA